MLKSWPPFSAMNPDTWVPSCRRRRHPSFGSWSAASPRTRSNATHRPAIWPAIWQRCGTGSLDVGAGYSEPRPSNLPVQRTAFIGRERESAALRHLLGREDVRLVTLTGPGGIGKTRLAVQVAGETSDRFPGGVYCVALSTVSEQQFDRCDDCASPWGARNGKPITAGKSERVPGWLEPANASAAR